MPATQSSLRANESGRLTDGDHNVRIVAAIVAKVVCCVLKSPWYEFATRGSIQDKQKTTRDTKNEHCVCQHILGRVALDERRDEDGSNTLERPVQARQDAYALEGDGDVSLLLQFVVSIGCQGYDGSVECLEPEFVGHDAGNVDGDVASLLGRVDVP